MDAKLFSMKVRQNLNASDVNAPFWNSVRIPSWYYYLLWFPTTVLL